jgi:hypothetical protein
MLHDTADSQGATVGGVRVVFPTHDTIGAAKTVPLAVTPVQLTFRDMFPAPHVEEQELHGSIYGHINLNLNAVQNQAKHATRTLRM